MDRITEYENARHELLQKLTGDQNALQGQIDEKLAEIRTLWRKHAEQFHQSEKDKVAVQITALQHEIKPIEHEIKELDRRMEDARQGRAPELQAAHMRAMQAPGIEVENAAREAERQVRQLLDAPEIKDAVAALHASVLNKEHVHHVVLEAVGLADLPRRIVAAA